MPTSTSQTPLDIGIGRRGNLSAIEAAELKNARTLMPGGVIGGNALPDDVRLVFDHGAGPRFWDTSGNAYIDYVLGSGSLFLGHAHPAILAAVSGHLSRGLHFFNYLNAPAVELARRIMPFIPCGERLRFTTSGSDATFNAIRMARAFTNRDKILKFEGAYHGMHDYAQLSVAPKQLANFPTPVPDTSGIPDVVRDLTVVSQFNDPDMFAAILAEHGSEIAAVIVEPIQRILSPKPGFLATIRELTRQYGIVMIMDEVVTGFRYGITGAQGYFNIVPDLATYGKIIGGGLPVGIVAGRAEILDQADPARRGQPGYVYQDGTLQGHLLGCFAALATLDVLDQPGVYDRVFGMANRLREGLQEVFDRHDLNICVFGEGPLWHMLFADQAPTNYREVLATDLKRLAALEREMIREGVFVLPNNRRFISLAHTIDELDETFAAVDRACVNFKRN